MEIEKAKKRAEQLQKERERSIKRTHLDWLDLLMEDLSCCRSSSSSTAAVVVIDGGGGSSSSSVGRGGKKMKSDDDEDEEKERLHPSVLVDTSVEASSFFK